MEPKKLYRTRTPRVFAGVCGGLGEYFDIDPVLIRILFVALAFLGGGGVLIYIILWIVLPEKRMDFGKPGNAFYSQTNPNEEPANPQMQETSVDSKPDWEAAEPQNKTSKNKGSLIGGMILITIGGIFLVQRFIPQVSFRTFWPLLLVVIGVILLLNSFNEKNK